MRPSLLYCYHVVLVFVSFSVLPILSMYVLHYSRAVWLFILVISYQLSVNSYQLSVNSYQLSVNSYLLIAV